MTSQSSQYDSSERRSTIILNYHLSLLLWFIWHFDVFYENTGLLWVKWRTVIKLKWYDTFRTALDQRYKKTRRTSSYFVWTAYFCCVESFIMRFTSNCPKVCIHILFCPAAIISLLFFLFLTFFFLKKDVFVFRTAFYSVVYNLQQVA